MQSTNSSSTKVFNGRSVGQGTITLKMPTYNEARRFRSSIAEITEGVDLNDKSNLNAILRVSDAIETAYFTKLTELFVSWNWESPDGQRLGSFNEDMLDELTQPQGQFLVDCVKDLFSLNEGAQDKLKK